MARMQALGMTATADHALVFLESSNVMTASRCHRCLAGSRHHAMEHCLLLICLWQPSAAAAVAAGCGLRWLCGAAWRCLCGAAWRCLLGAAGGHGDEAPGAPPQVAQVGSK